MKFNIIDYTGKPQEDWLGEVQVYDTMAMVEEVCTPDPYSSNGTIETLEERVNNMQKLLANLIDRTCTSAQAEEVFNKMSYTKVASI